MRLRDLQNLLDACGSPEQRQAFLPDRAQVVKADPVVGRFRGRVAGAGFAADQLHPDRGDLIQGRINTIDRHPQAQAAAAGHLPGTCLAPGRR